MTSKQTLQQWLDAEGHGAKNRLHLKAKVSARVIERALERRATLASATKLSRETGVAVETMTAELDDPMDTKVVALKPLKKKRAGRTVAVEARRKRAARG